MPEQILGSFANTIFKRTYAHGSEDWLACSNRVAKFISNGDKQLEKQFFDIISTRKFIPGGRYLAQSGKDIPQLNGCFLFKAEDSREGWAKLLDRHVRVLSTGGGAGTWYSQLRGKGEPIKRFGGTSSGPLSLMFMINEIARHVMAGGKRRSALLAGLAWWHPDINDFIEAKNWSTSIRAMKEQDFNAVAPLDMTNISVSLDDAFFKKVSKDQDVWNLYYTICKSMCKTGEPGFSIDIGKESANVIRNPCQPNWATVLTQDGIRTFNDIKEGSRIWCKNGWTTVIKKWSTGRKRVFEYRTTRGTFIGTDEHKIIQNGEKVKIKYADSVDAISGPMSRDYGLYNYKQNIMDGLVIGDGGIHKASNNLVLLYIGEKDKDYFDSEISSLIIKHRPGISKETYEIATTITSEELPRTYNRIIPERFYKGEFHKMQAFLRGLFSANGSIVRNRITLKQTSRSLINQVQEMLSALGMSSYITTNKKCEIQHKNGKYTSKESYALNISGKEDQECFFNTIGFIQKYKVLKKRGVVNVRYNSLIVKVIDHGFHEVYDITVQDQSHTYWTGGVLVSNCAEIVSDTDSDCCNLGSINLSRIKDLDELEEVTRLAVEFLYLGTFLSWMPHEDFTTVRNKNRRIGLGLMGLHEWCIKNNQKYEPNGKLGRWLAIWQGVSDEQAKKVAKKYKDVKPVAVRAIAPTGTIGIVGETTTGIEPVFCVAYKRRFLDTDHKWKYSYVIDPTVERLVKEDGLNPDDIEDAMTLAANVEKRISMQAFIQDYVDQAISSTINVPEWGEYGNSNAKKFAEVLLKYLPRLRGITVYPEGSRAGAPLTPIKYETAKKHKDVIYEESSDRCSQGVCGI